MWIWIVISEALFSDILSEHSLDSLLKDVPLDEADLFKHDLLILGLI